MGESRIEVYFNDKGDTIVCNTKGDGTINYYSSKRKEILTDDLNDISKNNNKPLPEDNECIHQ